VLLLTQPGAVLENTNAGYHMQYMWRGQMNKMHLWSR